jgi:glycosyltransferase involved in cell wall biosynthesis
MEKVAGNGIILVIGSDVVMPKLFYFKEEFGRLGLDYAVYTHDHSTSGREHAQRSGVPIIHGPPHRRSVRRVLKDWVRLFRILGTLKVRHVEFYFNYTPYVLLGYLYIIKARRLPLVVWFRGELYELETDGLFIKFFLRRLIASAKAVVLKETYMEGKLAEIGLFDARKTVSIHNSVALGPWRAKDNDTYRRRKILFLNMFKPWRNVVFLAHVASRLSDLIEDFVIEVVGDKSGEDILSEESVRLKESVEQLRVEKYVKIHRFTADPETYYKEGLVFLLPSKLIFCNYSLLEAMSFGLVPIVANIDDDYKKIIDDGECGFGLPLEADIWAEIICSLLSDFDRYTRISFNARRKIETWYSVDLRFEKYLGLLKSNVWPDAKGGLGFSSKKQE